RDMDAQRHVNNAVIATYFESGRVHMIRTPDLEIGVAGATFVLVHTDISFLQELRWPGDLVVGSAIGRIGRSSFTVEHALFKDETCAATGTATMVLIDRESRRPRPLPDDIVAKLSQWKRG
ncbi:MAG: thioesterase family protein, partial [Hyphomicrobium sp.]|nr:thioesterase family protein [Hyphomicrobium sp.]